MNKQYLVDISLCMPSIHGGNGVFSSEQAQKIYQFYEKIFKQYQTISDDLCLFDEGIQEWIYFRWPSYFSREDLFPYKERFRNIPCYKDEIIPFLDMAYNLFDYLVSYMEEGTTLDQRKKIKYFENQFCLNIYDPYMRMGDQDVCSNLVNRKIPMLEKETRDQEWEKCKEQITREIEKHERINRNERTVPYEK